MKILLGSIAAAIAVSATIVVVSAQPRRPQPFVVGQPVGVTVQGEYMPLSDGVAVFGGLVSVKGCAYDAGSGLIAAASRGYGQSFVPNDAFVSLINHDGSVHTLKWIGVNRNGGLVLNEPFGSDVANGTLYIADIDGGVRNPAGGTNLPTTGVIRTFSMATGEPISSIEVVGSPSIHDLEVTVDGTIYAVQRGPLGAYPPPETMRVYRIGADGTQSVVVEGGPMRQPTGIAIDGEGNLVVVNFGNDDVLTFSPQGDLLLSEKAPSGGNDGIVVAADGTKYVSSESFGTIARIRPGAAAEIIASGVPDASLLCLDTVANQLVVPLGTGNGIALVPLD